MLFYYADGGKTNVIQKQRFQRTYIAKIAVAILFQVCRKANVVVPGCMGIFGNSLGHW